MVILSLSLTIYMCSVGPNNQNLLSSPRKKKRRKATTFGVSCTFDENDVTIFSFLLVPPWLRLKQAKGVFTKPYFHSNFKRIFIISLSIWLCILFNHTIRVGLAWKPIALYEWAPTQIFMGPLDFQRFVGFNKTPKRQGSNFFFF